MNYWVLAFGIGVVVYFVVAGIIAYQGLEEREEYGPDSCTWTEIVFIAGLWPLVMTGYMVVQVYYRAQNIYQYYKHRHPKSRL